MPLATLHRASVKAGFHVSSLSCRAPTCAYKAIFHGRAARSRLTCSAAEDKDVIMMEQTIPVSVATEFMGVCMKTATQLVALHSPSGQLVSKVETAAASVQADLQGVRDSMDQLSGELGSAVADIRDALPDWDDLKGDLESAVEALSDLPDVKDDLEQVMQDNHEAVMHDIQAVLVAVNKAASDVSDISEAMDDLVTDQLDDLSTDVGGLGRTLSVVQHSVTRLGVDVSDVEDLLQDEIKPELEAVKEMMENMATKQEVAEIKSDLAELKASMAAVLKALRRA